MKNFFRSLLLLAIPLLAVGAQQTITNTPGSFTKINQNFTELYTNNSAVGPTGAAGDGVTNDAVALQACFDTKNCVLGKGKTYLSNSTLRIPSGGTVTCPTRDT